jgi:hypothetical protein
MMSSKPKTKRPKINPAWKKAKLTASAWHGIPLQPIRPGDALVKFEKLARHGLRFKIDHKAKKFVAFSL